MDSTSSTSSPIAANASSPGNPPPKASAATEDTIRALVYTFYDRVRADALIGPVFNTALDGRWDEHLPKMCAFWAGIVLGDKRYRGNVMQAHQPFKHVTPAHFDRWLSLFLDTVNRLFEPAAAREFMVPALRIAHSLQLGMFGWDFQLPASQQALLDQLSSRPVIQGNNHAANHT